MKSKIWKSVATGMAVLLTGVIVGTVVLNSSLEAEAADTFLGIQNLITEVSNNYQQNQEKYTILEIVPDRKAAEVGYLFDGCEPALSKWDDTEKRWISWREQLAACVDAEARKELIEGDGTPGSGLKSALGTYFADLGLTSYPVEIASSAYTEESEPIEGYERIDIPGVELEGAFREYVGGVDGTDGYQLVFSKAVWGTDTFEPGKYYLIKKAFQILPSDETISDSDTQILESSVDGRSPVYIKNELGEYEYIGVWEEFQTTSFSLRMGAEESLPEESTEESVEESTEETTEESVEESTEESVEESTEESTEESIEESTVSLPELNTAPGENRIRVLDPDSVSNNEVSSEEDDPEQPDNQAIGGENGSRPARLSLRAVNEPAIYVITFETITDQAVAEANSSRLYTPSSIQRCNYAVDEATKRNYGFYEFLETLDYATYTLNAETIYCKNTFTNQEWFKKYVLNMAEDEYGAFPVEVISYTPEELNDLLAVEGGRLPDFDFLYVNSGKSAEWVYSGDAREETAKKSGDLNANVCSALFTAVQAKSLPCLVDGNIIFKQNDPSVSTTVEQNDALKTTNIFKLCAMFGQKSLDNLSVITEEAFNGLNIDELWVSLADGYENGNFTTDQVYFHTGEKSIVNDSFGTATIYRDGMDVPKGFQKVLDEIELENLYRQSDTTGSYAMLSTDISEAVVIRHIMNYRNRRNAQAKSTINVLEIQPAKTKDGEPTLTLEQVKKWAPDVTTLNVTVMTTAEFIGKVETLNDKYDLIYIGTCKDHMNTTKGYQDSPAVGSTVFNDHSMDGLIYFHTGDMRYSGMELSGQLDTDYVGNNRANDVYYYIPVRYSGNDITREKKDALISYLNGSYPVVVAEDFFESPATVYQDIDYGGYSVNLEVGEYYLSDLEKLGVKNDDITSLKVKDGYRIICYWDNRFDSESITFTNEISYVGWHNSTQHFKSDGSPYNWNDKTSAIKVEKIPDSTPQRAIDTDHIDNSSYMYEFAKYALDNQYTNFYAFDEIEEDSQLFQFYLNRPKASLVNTSANGNEKDGIYYIKENNGRYTLEYHFTIVNEGAATADTRYQCKFYIDVNADGKFSSQEQLGDITLTSGDSSVASDQLYAGREYVLTRAVPDGYKGVLPWKVEISQVNNPNIYCFMDGYTKLEGLEKEILNILQISRDQVVEPDWWGSTNELLYSLAEQINGKATVYDDTGAYSVDDQRVENYESLLYHTLVYGGTYKNQSFEGISDDFEIDVDFMTINRFEHEYWNGNINMADYNMLILGFSDAYGDFTLMEDGSPGAPLQAIQDFIKSGKSVLLAHDTTSYFNYAKGKKGVINQDTGATDKTNQYHNASTLNTYIRGLVGMDRYGIMTIPGLRSGNGLNSSSSVWQEVLASGKDMAYVPKSNRTATVPQTQGYTYSIINSKDDHTAANVSAVEYSTEKTGLTSVWKNQYLNLKYDTVYYRDNYTDPTGVGYPDQGEIPLNYNGEVKNLIVTQVNKGQITEYPYKLAESFQVAATHGQYYQLDFTADDDQDGQSDLVVWYCLGGRTGSEGRGYQETIYSMSPNDVANNYYIYNKGNITYTGMGHAAARSKDKPAYTTNNCTVEEAKLFINTMIAAYNAGIKPPSVSIQESAVEGAPKQTVLYRYYDDDFALDAVDNATNPYENIYFSVRDVNFVKGTRNLSVKVYYDVPAGTEGAQSILVDGVSRNVKALDCPIYHAQTNAQVDPANLESGGIYYVQVPKNILQDCDGGLNLYFEAQSIISSNNKVYQTDKVYATLEVLKTYLFDLD